jgi:hypothetical protein
MSLLYNIGKAEPLALQTILMYSVQLSASQHQVKDDSFITSAFAEALHTIPGTIPVEFCSRNNIFYYVAASQLICTGKVNVKFKYYLHESYVTMERHIV